MGFVLGVFLAFYTTLLAWIVATLYYQITTAAQPLWIVVSLGLLGLLIAGLKAAGPVLGARE
jgi:hypothetical protein